MNNNALLIKSNLHLFQEIPRHLWVIIHNFTDKNPSPFVINVMRKGYKVEDLSKEYIEKFILKQDENSYSHKQYF